MRKPFCCEASQDLFDQYYTNQQKGGGGVFPVYVGRVRQRGHGIGDIFRSIWRFISPIFKTIAPHALRAGANIVEDVSSGNSWKNSTMKHGPSVLKQIPNAISAGYEARNNQSGSGYRRKRTRSTKRKSTKRRKRDIFS